MTVEEQQCLHLLLWTDAFVWKNKDCPALLCMPKWRSTNWLGSNQWRLVNFIPRALYEKWLWKFHQQWIGMHVHAVAPLTIGTHSMAAVNASVYTDMSHSWPVKASKTQLFQRNTIVYLACKLCSIFVVWRTLTAHIWHNARARVLSEQWHMRRNDLTHDVDATHASTAASVRRHHADEQKCFPKELFHLLLLLLMPSNWFPSICWEHWSHWCHLHP